jgi:hypothetical protein
MEWVGYLPIQYCFQIWVWMVNIYASIDSERVSP